MTDDQQARRVDEAAERFAASLVEAYKAVAGRSLSAQELNAQLTRSFFDRVIGNLRAQAEGNRALADSLIAQQREQQEAAQVLTGQSVGAYMDFLGSVFAPPRQGARTARHTAQEEDGPGPSPATGGEEGAVREDAVSHPLGTWVEPAPEVADAPAEDQSPSPGAASPAGKERAPREEPSPGEERPERREEIPTSPTAPREEPPPGKERPGRRTP